MFDWLRRLFEKPSEKRVAPATNPPGAVELPVSRDTLSRDPVSADTISADTISGDTICTDTVVAGPVSSGPVSSGPVSTDTDQTDVSAIVERHLGDLSISSGSLVLADSRCAPEVVLAKIPEATVPISATLQEFASGETRVLGLAIRTGKRPLKGLRRNIGRITIDSGTLVVADRSHYESHWTDDAKERPAVSDGAGAEPAAGWNFLRCESSTASHIFTCFPAGGTGSFKVFVEFDEDRPEGVWIGFEE